MGGMLVDVNVGMVVGVLVGGSVGVDVGVREGVGVCGTGWNGVRLAVSVETGSWPSRARPALPAFSGVMVGVIVGDGDGTSPSSPITSAMASWLLNCCRLASGLLRM